MAVTRLSFVDPALAPRRLQASPKPVRLQVARMGPPGAAPVVTADGIGAATAAALAAETSARAAADAAHVADLDPHPQYLTAAEASAAYSALGHGHAIGDTTGLQAALDGKQSVAGLAAAVNALIASAAGVVTQAYSAVLTELAALTPTTFGKSLLGLAGAAALRTSVALPTSTTAGRLARYTDAAGTQGQTAGLYEDASGNVGIGTTSPGAKLDVRGLIQQYIDASTYWKIQQRNVGYLGFLGNGADYFFGFDTINRRVVVGSGNTLPASRFAVDGNQTIGNGYLGTAAPANGLLVEGSVGIGTTSPGAKLVLQGDGSYPSLFQILKPDGTNLLRSQWDGGNFHHFLGGSLYYNLAGNALILSGGGNSVSQLLLANGTRLSLNGNLDGSNNVVSINDGSYATVSSPLTVVTALKIGTWAWNGANGSTISSSTFMRQRQLSASNNDARLEIADSNSVVRIALLTQSGNVGIGTTSPSTTLHVNGPIRCGTYTVATVPSAVTSGAGAIIYVSDESGGAVSAFSDGTNWRRVTDRAIIS